MKFSISIKAICCIAAMAYFSVNVQTIDAQFKINKTKLKSKVKKHVNKNSSENNSSESSTDQLSTNPPISNSKADKVFDANKENLLSCHNYLKEFSEARSDKAETMAPDVPAVLKLAEQTTTNLSKVIEKPYSSYERTNPEADKIHFSSKMSFTERYISSSKEKLKGIKDKFLRSTKESAEWLGSEYGNIKHAPRVMNEIHTKFETLDKIFPNNTEIAEAKKTTIPLAEKNYKKLLESTGKNRMSSDKYSGSDKSILKKKLSDAYAKSYPNSKVLKVVITDQNWTTKKQLINDNINVYWETADYISTQVATAKKDAAKVYVITFKRTKQGAISLYSVGSNFDMLQKNL